MPRVEMNGSRGSGYGRGWEWRTRRSSCEAVTMNYYAVSENPGDGCSSRSQITVSKR